MRETVEKIKAYVAKHRSFFLYIVIGFTGLTLDFTSFMVMINVFKIPVLIANPIAMSVGIINNFFLNAFYNFKKTDKLFLRLLSFYSVGLVGIVLSDLFMWLFHEYLNYSVVPVKGVSIVLIGFMQYFLNKYLSFRGKTANVN